MEIKPVKNRIDEHTEDWINCVYGMTDERKDTEIDPVA
jgi:hypothetical protein